MCSGMWWGRATNKWERHEWSLSPACTRANRPYGEVGKNRRLDLQTLSPDRRRAIIWRENCAVAWRSPQTHALSNTHTHTPRQTHTHTPHAHPSPNLPREECALSPLKSQRIPWVFRKGIDRPRHNTEAWCTSVRRPSTHRLRVFKSMKVQVIVHGGERFQKAALRCKIDSEGSTCSREDGRWAQGSDRAHQQRSLSPHEGRPESSRQNRKKTTQKRCSPLFSWTELDVIAPEPSECWFPL